MALIIIPRILLIAVRKNLYDIPNARKIHTKSIPRLGGTAFYPTILFSCCSVFALSTLFDYHTQFDYLISEFLLLICGMTLLYLIGIADDLIGVHYRQKFLIQIICASFLPFSGIWIDNFYGLFGLGEIPFFAGIPLTIFMVVFITNAINLIDGIDGLASGLSSVSLLIIGVLFLHKESWLYSAIAFATFGVLVPFFYYNVFDEIDNKGKKIFMGDTGSLTLGYIISFLVIKYSIYNSSVTATTNTFLMAFTTLIIPIFDCIRVILFRFRTGKKLFQSDKSHIHHKLLATGIKPKRVMIYLIIMGTAFSVVNILLIPYWNDTLLVIFDMAVWIGANLYWNKIRDGKATKAGNKQ
jgi:UDP-N-acetylmuramyl pentapeptide phosphotransferase/UDP-N-acetylglucosamine-1-phosphate transferase